MFLVRLCGISLLVSALFLLNGCDSAIESEPDAGPDLISQVRSWYETTLPLHQDSLEVSYKTEGRFKVLAAMVKKYPPDWDNAVAFRSTSGSHHVAALLGAGESTACFSNPELTVIRTFIGDVNARGRVTQGRLVEFVSSVSLSTGSLAEYAKQWLSGDFGDTPMLAAEYSIGYAERGAMMHTPGDTDPVPQPVSLKRRVSVLGKTQETIWWCFETVYADICVDGPYPTGSPSPGEGCTEQVETTCVCISGCTGGGDGGGGGGPSGGDGGYTGGGGGGGGGDGNDDDGDDSDDDDNSQCTEDQEAIAKEYDSAAWPCEIFVDSITPGDGTHSHVTGYLSGAYKSGRDAVWAEMSSEFGVTGWIESDWRCPEGNVRVGGVSRSQHVEGTAGDFDAVGFNETMWEQFERAAINAGRGWNSGFKGGKPENRRERNYRGHIHIDWR